MRRFLFTSLLALCANVTLLQGQIISVRTIPLIAASQFAVAPSYRLGMGGASIALDDELADGFYNPALVTMLDRNILFLAPYRNTWSEFSGDGWQVLRVLPFWTSQPRGSLVQALPVGTIRHIDGREGGRLSFGLALSVEQLRHASHTRTFWDTTTNDWNEPMRVSATNLPLSGMAALRLPGGRLALGAGVDAVLIRGVDGIPLLYPGAQGMKQSGYLAHYRIGLSALRPDDGRFDALLLHKRYHMDQEAIYDWQENVQNKDEEQSWLMQLHWRRSLPDNLQAGLELTGQWKTHPKIPDYPAPEISIPRDPGITKAGRLGLGFSHQYERLTTALDLALEVIDSRTWGDTTAPVTADDGHVIAAGDPLFRNDYFFVNTVVRLGIEFRVREQLRLQGGLNSRHYSMDFYHKDEVTGEEESLSPQRWWKEPTYTIGAIVTHGPLEWIYHAQMSLGMGIPYRDNNWWWGWGSPWLEFTGMRMDAAGDILVPPTGMNFQNLPVVLHQLTLVWSL